MEMGNSALEIYVRNDAFAFFDVGNPLTEPTAVRELERKYKKDFFALPHHFLVDDKQVHYFITDGYNGELNTVSVTGPCIIFCAFTGGKDGKIRSSGVYHALSYPESQNFKEGLDMLIDTVRVHFNDVVTVKAAGGQQIDKYSKRFREYLTNLLAAKHIGIGPKHLSLGGARITRFHTLNGQLTSYDSKDKQQIALL